MELMLNQKVLSESDELGTALSELPEGYAGPCVVEVTGRTSQRLGFSNETDAVSAACFAVGELGGFHQAVVRPGKASPDKTYAKWTDWAFET